MNSILEKAILKRKVLKTLKPGAAGTRDLLNLFGERLVAVRYCKNEDTKTRFKTIELRIEHGEELIGIQVNKKRST